MAQKQVHQNINLIFHVLADPNTVNAFVLPGGQVFITMGLLKLLKTEDQLAGVLIMKLGMLLGVILQNTWQRKSLRRD